MASIYHAARVIPGGRPFCELPLDFVSYLRPGNAPRLAADDGIHAAADLGCPRLIVVRLASALPPEPQDELRDEFLALLPRKGRGCRKGPLNTFRQSHADQHRPEALPCRRHFTPAEARAEIQGGHTVDGVLGRWTCRIRDSSVGPARRVLAFVEPEPRPTAAPLAVACPACGWHPDAVARWACDCGFTWNTFDTRGRCPA